MYYIIDVMISQLASPNGTNGGSTSAPLLKRVQTVTEAPSPYISGRHLSMDEEQPKLSQVVADAMWYDSVTKRRAATITLKATRHLATSGCAVSYNIILYSLTPCLF